jgi:lysophospholipase L1-like esterase
MTQRILLGVLLVLGLACDRRTNAPPAQATANMPTTTPAPSAQLRFLALGDSYTIGESVRPEERWPMQLAVRLREEGIAVADPVIIARTGWRTDDLSAGIDRANPQGPFDLVGLLIGVNNQYQGRSADAYRGEFARLLKRAIALAGGNPSRVIVLSIPDWGATPFAAGHDRARIGAEIDRFNAINREETKRAGARYVDVTLVSREAPAHPELIAGDGLHPSGKMYAEWVRLVVSEAKASIAARPAAGR